MDNPKKPLPYSGPARISRALSVVSFEGIFPPKIIARSVLKAPGLKSFPPIYLEDQRDEPE